MKYINEAEESSTWVMLSTIWAAAGFLAWLCAWFDLGLLPAATGESPSGATGSALTMLALVISLVGVALRLPILSTPPRTNEGTDHFVLLLGYIATVNWLGYLLLRSNIFVDVLPALLVLLSAEAWFHSRIGAKASVNWVLKWLGNTRMPQTAILDVEKHTADESGSNQMETQTSVRINCDQSENDGAERAEAYCRKSVDAIDDSGRRYLSGEVWVALAAKQTTDQIVIGFCPAFDGAPDVEFEADDESASVRLVNCTPTGMRLAIRRPSSAEPLEFGLHWYAVQLASEAHEASAAGKTLP